MSAKRQAIDSYTATGRPVYDAHRKQPTGMPWKTIANRKHRRRLRQAMRHWS